jgi:hypothetical protein
MHPVNQCFGSESGSALNPHSIGSWIRIRIANADSNPEGEKLAQKRITRFLDPTGSKQTDLNTALKTKKTVNVKQLVLDFTVL